MEGSETHLWRQRLLVKVKEMAHAWGDLVTTADTCNLLAHRAALQNVATVAAGADDLIAEIIAFVKSGEADEAGQSTRQSGSSQQTMQQSQDANVMHKRARLAVEEVGITQDPH